MGAFTFVPAYAITFEMTLLSSVGVPTSVASGAVTIHIPHYSSAESHVSLTTDLSLYNSIKIGVRRMFNVPPGVCFYSTIRGGPSIHNNRYSSSVTHPLPNYQVAIRQHSNDIGHIVDFRCAAAIATVASVVTALYKQYRRVLNKSTRSSGETGVSLPGYY